MGMDRHHVLATDAASAEVRRQRRAALVEPAVAPGGVRIGERNAIRVRPRVGREEGVYGTMPVVAERRPRVRKPGSSAARQQSQVADPLPGVVDGLRGHARDLVEQLAHPIRVEERRPVHDLQPDVAGAWLRVEREVERRPGGHRLGFDVRGRGPRRDPTGRRGRVPGGVVQQVEEHLEHGRTASVPLRTQVLEQQLERRVLVGVGAEGHIPHPRHELDERRVSGEVEPQR